MRRVKIGLKISRAKRVCWGANKMGVEKDTYENPSVNRIVANVRACIRTKTNIGKDLQMV